MARSDFYFDLAAHNPAGYSPMLKFGKAFDFGSGDDFVYIWDGCGNASADLPAYTFSTTDDIDSLSSSDDGDTMDVTVVGLDASWDVVTQTITLTGQTRVALTTDLIRVYRMYTEGSTDPAGDIFCFKNVATTGGVPNTAANIRAIITATFNQTQMAIYPIPARKKGLLTMFYATLLSRVQAECEVHLRVREFGSVFRIKQSVGVVQQGSSFVKYDYKIPLEIGAKADVVICSDTNINATSMSAGFDVVLIDV